MGQTAYDSCWFDCGEPVPPIVMVDIQNLEGKAEELNDDFNFFLNCYPSCDRSAMSSNWNSMMDDGFHICKGVRRVTCDYPDEATQTLCRSIERHPCRRWGDTSPLVMLLESPPVMLESAPETASPTSESTAVMLMEA